jgi:hypothetical protein
LPCGRAQLQNIYHKNPKIENIKTFYYQFSKLVLIEQIGKMQLIESITMRRKTMNSGCKFVYVKH